MRVKKTSSKNRFLAGLLALVMLVGLLPASVFAADDDLTTALAEAKEYTDALTIDNSSNDPATVVSNFKTHFTWDNEKRENSKSYLFDWSYYNGVVFEGIEYLYEVTGEKEYADYVIEYMSSLIASDGTWATCSNNSSKQCAGYNSTHGADCYKTASLLLDAYDMTGDSRYLTMAATLYADLDAAAETYSLSKAGGNYRHTWASDPSPDLWLDGLYMILPFRAEYAEYIEDTAELDLIVDRMQWVSDNMYNAETGLFYHAADSATSNSGTYWLRSIGWYAAAIVDIMDCMEGENLEAMKAQLVKLVNGMKACQDSGNGMWLNNMAASESASNPYETSGTALVSYAVMKAVNKGWLDESYADMAIAAFEGICNEKLSGTTLTDICFKGVPSGSNSTFYDNEGKGVGPFIMLYAEVQEYVDYLESEPEVTEETFTFEDAGNILKVTATATAMSAKNVSGEVEAVAELLNDDYTAYEFSLNDWEKNTDITVVLSLGAAYDEQTLTVYYIDSNGTAKSVSGNYVVGTDKDGFQIVTISDAAEGTYAFGAPYVKVDANATLTGLEITNAPDIAKYFVEETNEDGILSLDITGLVVEATYSDGTTREIPWNEFGEVEDGYSLTVDMAVLGDQDVEVSYTYGEVTLTDSFTITIYDEVFSEDNSSVTIQVTVPGVTDIFVNENTAEDFVVAAAEKVLESYVSYDIELEGYTQGEEVTVTLPIPAGVEKAAVYYIPEDGSEPEDMGGANNGDGTISFTTDHFSTYAVGSRAGDALEGTGNLAGGEVYTLNTDEKIDTSEKYLIVNTGSDGDGYALTNNNGYAGSTKVTISNSTITVEDDSDIAWQFSDSTSGTVSNNGRYVYLGSNSVLSTSTRTLNITSQGSGAYTVRRPNSYYLRYNNGSWSRSNSESSVYLYEYTDSSSGEAVTFKIAPGQTTVVPEGILNLNGTVTVDGETVELSKCEIEWKSSSSAATVSDGIVTGVADGSSAVITASLTEVDGKALVTPINLSVTVTVASKTITGVRLIDAETVETTVNTQPDFSNVLLEVTYDDGTYEEINGNDNRITITGYDITQNGTYFATVKYGEEELGTVTVIVKPSYPSDKAETYPEYPADGAVRIKKTAEEIDFDDTGVVKVELDVAGISVRKGVNVILISDISNSMSWDDSTYSYSDVTVTAGTNQRLNISKASAKAFVNELLTPADGQENLNTVTLLAFAGIDGDYNDHSTASANDDVYQLGDLAMMDIAAAEEAINQQKKATTGGTNYDYAFQQAYALAEQLYELNGQEVHIVFMTDGVPTHYNGVYYKSRNNTDLTALMNYVDPTTGETSRYTSTGNDRNGNDIDATATTGITVYYNDGTTETKNVTYNKGWSDYVINNQNGWAEKTKDLDYVAKVYSIGFGMKNGSVTQGATSSMPTLNNVNGGQYYIPSSTTQTLLKHISSTADDYYEADNQEELQALYESLATQIKFAGTSAQATDVISSDFTLQMAETSGTGDRQPVLADYGIDPSITIKAYDLWTKDETTDAALIGTRSGDVTAIETITFSADGSEAYSDQIDDGDTNIMTRNGDDIVITAKYFTYSNIDGYESFTWNIGNITDKEIALSFYAYLKGSMEGEESKGTRYTNEEAYLEYIDINGDYAVQVFPKPVVVWGGASTAYEFYLVNDKGETVNRNGEVIPFANRIVITGPYYEELNLNAGDNYYSKEIVAAKVLPAGYTLYDDTSYYTVKTASGDAEEFAGSLEISEPAAGKAQTTICISFTPHSYIQSHVAFGVLYNEIPEVVEYFMTPDAVVFDYGKPMAIDISTNNTGIPSGYTGTLVGFSKYYDYTEDDLKKYYSSVTSMTEYDTDFGVFTISDGEVLYTPTAITKAVDRVYCIIRIVEDGNSQNVVYMVNPLSVIPATSVYYETDFSLKDGAVNPAVFALTDDWTSKTDGTTADGPQNDGTIGQNTYGYDTTYNNDSLLSNGSSLFVEGQGVKATTAKFSFTGTGFDIISRTGAEQGAIRVEVFTDINRTTANRVRSITVLNKSESNLELYQIPVVSVNDLPYDTYYVTIGVNAAYTNTNYPELDRGGEFYFDALRVFNPIDTEASTADALDAASAYRQDGELNPQVDEVREMMLDATTFNPDNISDDVRGVVFVDSTYTTKETENGSETTPDHKTGSVEIGTYAAIGPNNEVYLENGQAIAFKVNASSMPASFDVGAKSITGATAILNAVVTDDAKTAMKEVAKVTSSTAQNFNLMDVVEDGALDDGQAYVIISNSGEGVLSITDLKVAFGGTSRIRMLSMRPETTAVEDEDSGEDEPVVVYTVDAATYAVASAVLLNVEEDTPDTEEKPEAEKPKPGKPEKPDKEKPAKPEKPNKPNKDFEDDKSDKNENPNKNNKPGQNNKPGKQNNGKGNRK